MTNDLERIGTLEGALTKQAQDCWGPEAEVWVFNEFNREFRAYILKRPGREDLRLGRSWTAARVGLGAINRGEYQRRRLAIVG